MSTGNQREIPTRENPDKVDPVKDPGMPPDKDNPAKPIDKNKDDQSKDTNSIQKKPGEQITS